MIKKFCKKQFLTLKLYLYLSLYTDKSFHDYEEKINLIFKKKFKKNIVKENLNLKGFYVIDSFLDNEMVNILKDEFDKILKIKSNNFDKNKTKTIQIRNYDKSFYLKNKLFLSYILFNNTYTKEVIENILEKKFDYNSEIFFQKTYHTQNPLAGDFHFDKKRSIKIWFNVNDCMENNGPLECIEGTHLYNKQLRMSLKNEKINGKEYNVLKSNNKTGVKLVSKAGSMIIFDSDVSHKATPVNFGQYREIIRGATFS